MKKRYKFKKLINEYRSLFYELKYIKEVLKDGNLEFETYHRQYCADNDLDLNELNSKNSKRIDQIFSNNTGIMINPKTKSDGSEFDPKHLFRQIARKFHPDTVAPDDPQQKEFEEVFKKASGAIDNGRWGELFDIADKHDLALGDYGEINKCLEIDIVKVKKEIKQQKDTYAWLLFECDGNEDCKQNIVRRFLKHLFNI
jgi:hypothetical protein